VSRTSDTRQRTREAAADLVAQGHRPHAITVDLIYAAIRQGSRTTINDELKLWKDERSRADALGADLPPIVADRMRSLWAVAVEHSECTFEQQREALEALLGAAREELSTVAAARDQLRATHELLTRQVGTLGSQLTELRAQLDAESSAKNEAISHAHALQQELAAVRLDSARRLESVRQEREKQTTDFQQAIAARDVAFRAELDRATQRLESAQAHMLQQIDDARQGQRRAEAQAAKIQQQRDQLQSEFTELRIQLNFQAHQLEQRDAALQMANQEVTRREAERQHLLTDLAESRGRLETMEKTLRSLEARAVAAETRLAETVGRGDAKPSSRTPQRTAPASV
jgi:chromosome segregation ATPase